jgi:hypothetical protein
MNILKQREGFTNRHTDGLPKENCLIKIIVKDVGKEFTHVCDWKPYDPSLHGEKPAEGYLGTARVVTGRCKGIGFNAWEQNDSEFVWYSKIEGTEEVNH